MTRINTNVSSLVAQNTLGRSHSALDQALTRLSTGLRINTGKDDPAGLIASENLRSDITSITKAISNTDRANEVIATADSALGQVSGLLNDIRGLVTEAANTGAAGSDQIAANQLQIDQSLKALNQIAQTVTFQGRKLLDGGLDFTTQAGSNFSQLSGLSIDQANLGATGSLSVDVDVTAAATKASLDITGITTSTAAANATTSLTVSNAATQATGTISTTTTTTASTFTLTAKSGGAAAGAAGNQTVTLAIADGTTEGASYNATTHTLTATIDITGGNDTVAHLASIINAGADFATGGVTNGTNQVTATDGGSTALAGGRDIGTSTIQVTADAAGAAFNNKTVTLQESNTIANNSAIASLDASNNITVNIRGTVTKAAIGAAIDGLTGYHASISQTGDQNYIQANDSPPGVATTGSGTDATGGLATAASFELSGANGSEVLTFGANTSAQKVVDAINQVQDATGVAANLNGTTGAIELKSTKYGSSQNISLKLQTGTTSIGSVSQDTSVKGTDVVATVNGITAKGDGNQLSINTSTLDLKTSVAAGFTGTSSFNITGGGALFQLGPDVVSNQQTRIGITSVNTAKLGGVDGALFELASGGDADLTTSPNKAASIVESAITQITSLRGRLGAFQSTSLETNKNTLNDTLVNLTEAQSSISDADFAKESAALTRAQILVQSGTTVLQIANQSPQNVLALLRQ
jgi:flagellin